MKQTIDVNSTIIDNLIVSLFVLRTCPNLKLLDILTLNNNLKKLQEIDLQIKSSEKYLLLIEKILKLNEIENENLRELEVVNLNNEINDFQSQIYEIEVDLIHVSSFPDDISKYEKQETKIPDNQIIKMSYVDALLIALDWIISQK